MKNDTNMRKLNDINMKKRYKQINKIIQNKKSDTNILVHEVLSRVVVKSLGPLWEKN